MYHSHTDLAARTAVKQEKEWKLGSVVLQTAVTSGRVRWWFRINGGHKTTVGIVTSEYQAQRDSYINKGTQGWGYYQENGNKGNGGPATDSCVMFARPKKKKNTFPLPVASPLSSCLSDRVRLTCVTLVLLLHTHHPPGMESLSLTLAPLLQWIWTWTAAACGSI